MYSFTYFDKWQTYAARFEKDISVEIASFHG